MHLTSGYLRSYILPLFISSCLTGFLQYFAASQPKVHLPAGKKFDFGLIMEDTRFAKDFPVVNNGTDTLILSGLRTSCGCTAANLTSDRLPPGDSVVLHIIINTKDFVDGGAKKDVYFETNDPAHPKVDIVMNMVIKSWIQCLPTYVNFSSIALGDSAVKTEYIKNNTDTTITIKTITAKESQILAHGFPLTIPPGDSAGFTAVLYGKKAGNALGQFEITTDHPKKPSIPLTYIGYVHK